MLVDSHCHLDFPDFAAERDAVIARARAAGVGTMLTIGTRLDQFDGVRAIAEAHDGIWCSVGAHPHEAADHAELHRRASWSRWRRHPKVVGIGETGLDFHYDLSPRDIQERVFRAHIAASRDERSAADHPCPRGRRRDRAILAEERPPPGVLHCFSSGRGAGRDGARARLLHFDFRHRDLPECRGIARDRARPAARPAAGRDRRALSRAGAVSRQAQRAGLCRGDRGGGRGAQGRRRPSSWPRRRSDNFFRLFTKATPARSV